MEDQDKTKEQLMNELAELHQRVAGLEMANIERVKVGEALITARDVKRKARELLV